MGGIRDLVLFAATSPLIFVGLRNAPSRNCWKLIAFSALACYLTNFATTTDSIFGIKQPDWLKWNWIGKLACIVTIILIVTILPSHLREKTGIFHLPSRDSKIAVAGFLVFCASLGCLTAFDLSLRVDRETLAYQLLMPSLAEEPLFRGILPALLGTALGSPWKIAGAQLGWWWLAIAVYFGLGHAVNWSHENGLEFQAIPFVIITLFDLPYGWIAARSGSVWPCVIGHSLNNSTYLAIAFLLKNPS